MKVSSVILGLILAIFAVAALAAKKTDIDVLEVKSRRGEQNVTVDGKLRVTAEKPLRGLVLEFAFLSDSGDVLITEKTEVTDETLQKDDEQPFHAETHNPPGAIQYKIRAFDGFDRELRIGNPGPFVIE
jgi:hypothetical protein